jgi:putative tricarboxylic transport membrane protein
VNADRVSFGCLFAIALYGLASSLLMPLGEFHEPGPGFFPLCLSAILFILSFLGILSSRRPPKDLSRSEPFWGYMKTPFKIVLATALAILAFEPVGFLATSALFLTMLFLWVSRYAWWKAVAFGMVGSLAGRFFFVRLLGVPMPEGLFGF